MLLTVLFLWVLYGCSPTPEQEFYAIPTDLVQEKVEAAGRNPSFAYGELLTIDWWTIFDDEQLSLFIERALERHPSMQIAEARFHAAFDLADENRSLLFPTLGYQGDVSRFRQSKTGIFGAFILPPIPGVVIPPFPFSYWQPEMSLNLQYDLDLWGKNRSALAAAVGQARASQADEASARLLLSVSVAQTYFNLQTNLARADLYRQVVANRQKYAELIKLRVSKRLDTDLSLLKAENDIQGMQQILTQVELDSELNRNQLRALLGNDLEADESPFHVSQRIIPRVPLPAGIPMELLSYRPDVIAALWRVDSAAKMIDVAVADFFPNINLLGFVGVQTIHPKELLERKSLWAQAGPAWSLPLFDGGLRIATLKYEQQEYIVAVEQYNQTVLNAVKDVLDGIASVQQHDELLQENKAVEKNNQEVVHLTEKLFHNRLFSALDVLNAERDLWTSQDQEIQAEGSQLLAVLSLIKSLGGGYKAGFNSW